MTPEYILNNWTDELLDLMIQKMMERKEREARMLNNEERGNVVSDKQLFEMLKGKIRVEKK